MVLRRLAFSATTSFATAILEVVDALLVATITFSRFFALLLRGRRLEHKPSVVIVGASFAGLWAQRALSSRFDVTLIDLKDYFEYTPGVLRLFVEPEHLHRIARPLPSKHCKTVVAEVTEVAPDHLTVRAPGESKTTTINFDYLLLACGSLYPAVDGQRVVKAGAEQPSLKAREGVWADAAARLKASDDAIVVGGGPVGVELAAEIADVYPEKRVTLISRSDRLCNGMPLKIGDACLAWLRKRHVEVLLSTSTTSIRKDGVTLSNGKVLSAGVVYNCAGSTANSAILKSNFAKHLDQSGRLIVNDNLQVEGHPTIFGMGDLMVHPKSDELKLGHTAELNAHVVAHNVIAMADAAKAKGGGKAVKGDGEKTPRKRTSKEKYDPMPSGYDLSAPLPLASYPEGAHGLTTSPQVYCVSLGKHSAVMGFNGLVLSGWVPSVLKWLLEWTKVAACEERPVGTLFWEVADGMTAIMSKTVLKVPARTIATGDLLTPTRPLPRED